ncbi:MAG: esterase [Robiginitalea sp.]
MSGTKPEKSVEKQLTFQTTHPYATLNAWTGDTERIWMVFHGIGFLSRYFLRYFTHLDPVKNYIIAPQAPSLYYLDSNYRNIGASWLTREQTQRNMNNLLNYLDALYGAEALHKAPKLTLMAYSQGVSVLCRWVAARKIPCERIILYAGRVPDELDPSDFAHLSSQTAVEFYAGDSDPYLHTDQRPVLEDRLKQVFGNRLRLHYYEGGHELKSDLIRS